MDKFSNNVALSRLQIPVSDRSVTSEMSGDFVLPDYQPEIKRLLRIGASVLPPSKYIGERDAELAGSLDYYVYYLGSDDMLYLAPITTEYKISLPLDGENEEKGGFLSELYADALISPDMISGRVTAPRKLSIKCRLKCRAQIFGYMPLEDGYSHGEDGLQVLRGKMRASEYLRGVSDLFHVTDEMICDSRDGEVRVVSAEGKTLFSEVGTVDNAIVCRGDLFVKLLLCREEEGTPYTALRKMPFSYTVAVDGVKRGDSASARGSVCEMSVTVEDGRIGIDGGVIIEAQAAHSDEVEYVKDVYSTGRKSANAYKNIDLARYGVCFGGNFTLSDSMTLEEAGMPFGAKIVDVGGNATVEEYSFDGAKCTLSGKAKFALLTEKDGEFGVCEIELPFTYRTEIGEASHAACCCEVVSVRAKADGERVGIDAEIGVSGSAHKLESESLLSEAAFGDEIEGARGEIVVCYPSDSDSLWSVAKRYGADFEQLRESNGISAEISSDAKESLENVNFLVI